MIWSNLHSACSLGRTVSDDVTTFPSNRMTKSSSPIRALRVFRRAANSRIPTELAALIESARVRFALTRLAHMVPKNECAGLERFRRSQEVLAQT